MQNLTAQDIMQTEDKVRFLTLNSTYADAKEFTRAGRFSSYNFPLVDCKGKFKQVITIFSSFVYIFFFETEKMILLGIVKRNELVKLLSTAKRNEKLVTEQTKRANFAHFQANSQSISEFISDIHSDTKSNFADEEEKEEEEEFILPDEFDVERYSSFPLSCTDETSDSASLVVGDTEIHALEDEKVDIWSQPIPYVFANIEAESDFTDMVVVDPTPFQIAEQVPIAKIHFIFTMLGLRDICVTQRGRFIGLITKNNLLSVLQ